LSKSCIFCEIVKGDSPCTKIYEDEHVLAFLDINPVSENHTLIIPKGHYVNLYDIPEAELKHLLVSAKRIALQFRNDHDVQGVNVLHASGVEAQQSVLHFHLHIVPRRIGDRLDHFLLPEGLTT